MATIELPIRTVELPIGTVEHRALGPDDPNAPTAVFVHGFLVNGTLWHGVAERLAAQGVRAIVPEWPLGAHRVPVPEDRELSPRSIAAAIIDLLAALDLHDVVLVGNDTGGGLCQLALDLPGAERIGGLVLTNCDAFERFPPPFFVPLFVIARSRPAGWLLLQTTRLRANRHSPLAYGLLLRRPRSAALTRGWVQPALDDAAIRRDIRRFTRALQRTELLDSASWLTRFDRPVRLVWGMLDRHFTASLARRLLETFPRAELVEIDDATTFVPIDRPDAVVDGVMATLGQATAAAG